MKLLSQDNVSISTALINTLSHIKTIHCVDLACSIKTALTDRCSDR